MPRILLIVLFLTVSCPTFGGVILTNTVANLKTERAASGNTVVEVRSSDLFGPRAIARGIFASDLDADAYPPDPIRWLSGIEPTPFKPLLSVIFDSAGDFLRITSTSLISLQSIATGHVYGSLDFSAVSGASLGSLVDIQGVELVKASGRRLAVDAFSITHIPEPSSMLLFGLGFAGVRALTNKNRRGAT